MAAESAVAKSAGGGQVSRRELFFKTKKITDQHARAITQRAISITALSCRPYGAQVCAEVFAVAMLNRAPALLSSFWRRTACSPSNKLFSTTGHACAAVSSVTVSQYHCIKRL